MAAPSNSTVQHLVACMLHDRTSLWRHSQPDQLAAWMDWQARIHASGAIEAYTLDDHPMSKVSHIRLNDFALASTATTRRYLFDGKAWSDNPWIPLRKRWTHVAGALDLRFDEFGRVRRATPVIE